MQYFSHQGLSASLVRSFLIVPTLVLAGCGGGGGGGDSASAPAANPVPVSTSANSGKETAGTSEITLAGVAMKGAIANAIVTVYGVEQQASYHQISAEPLAAPVRTNADGGYSIKLKVPSTSALVVKVSVDGTTTMACDVTAGCEDASGATVAFGAPMALPADFSLYSAVTTGKDKQQTIHVSPLTHLAYEWAASQSAGLSVENIASGRQNIATTLDLPSDILSKQPLDLTKLSTTANVASDVLTYSVLSASFLALANSPNWQNIDEVMDAAAGRFATTGKLVNVNLGGLPEITKSDLYYSAAEIAGDLAATSPGGTSSKLTEIAQTTSQAADSMVSSGTQAEPVHITFNPSSVTLFRDESVTFNVNATGTGPISYQWRKNGVAIAGATSEHLTLSAVTSADAGLYDCVISNEVGSVASLTATLTVEIPDLTLTWTPPATRVDGTDLDSSELKGYRLVYGTSAGELTQTVDIEDPFTTQYTFNDLPAATYFFAIKAIDELGNESSLSSIVSKTL